MFPLIGLALQAAPYIARWIGGDSAGEATKAVSDIVATVTKTTSPTEAELALKDPKVYADLQIKLGEFHSAQEQRLHEERLEEFRQVTDARRNYPNAKNITDALAKGTVAAFFILNTAVVSAIFAMMILGAPGFVKANVELAMAAWGMVNAILGWVNSKTDVVFNFFMGSSHGSSEGREAMANVLNKLTKGLMAAK